MHTNHNQSRERLVPIIRNEKTRVALPLASCPRSPSWKDPQCARRLEWVDAAKAAAILLMVFGHVLRGLNDRSLLSFTTSSFWAAIDNGIYLFHMPLFFFLSGYTTSKKEVRFIPFAKRLMARLAWPYMVWIIAFISLKLVFNGDVFRPVTPSTYIKIFYDPISPFWFLYALFVIRLSAHIILKISGPWLFLILSFGAFCLHFHAPFGGVLQAVLGNSLFFALGMVAIRTGEFRASLSSGGLAVALFAVTEAICAWKGISYPTVTGQVAAIVLVLSVARAFSGLANNSLFGSRIVQFVGRNTLPIYCMHPIVLGLCSAVFARFGVTLIPLHLVVKFAAGSALPLLIFWGMNRVGVAQWFGFGSSTEPRAKQV